ncbi:MAG: WD40 repeat domain-containing protein [Treponema sp.]|nr:WD40 repeat domain-containing protein [Treponema sp.]
MSFFARRVSTFLICLILSSAIYAQELVIPMIKTVSPVRCVTWNKNGSTFAYAEDKKIILRDSSGYKLIQSIETNNGVIDFLQFPQSTGGIGDQLVSLSADDVLEFRILPQTDPIHVAKSENKNTSTALAYNYNGNYIATGTKNGALNVLLQNYLTNVFISRTFSELEAPIYSLYFSRNNKTLVSASGDDSVCLWDVASGKLLNAFPYYSKTKVPVLMTHDNKNIIMTTDKKKIGIFDLSFKQIRSIETEVEIQSMTLSADGNKLIILTTDNFFYFYDILSTKITNYIPPYNSSKITSYAFNNTNSRAVVCHSDGCLYVLDIGKVLLDPSQPAPRFDAKVAEEKTDFEITQFKPQEKNIPKDRDLKIKKPEFEAEEKKAEEVKEEEKKGKLEEVFPDDKKTTAKAEKEKEKDLTEKEKEELKKKNKEEQVNALSEFLFKNNERANTIDVAGLVALYPSPYLFAAGLDVEWHNTIWTAPFYFGAGLKATMGFPTSDFPYSYTIDGTEADPPNFLDLKAYLPGGIQIILPGDVMRLSAEFFVSGGVSMVAYLGKASSTPVFSFGGGARIGFGVKYVSATVGINYDSILGWVPEVIVGGRINIGKKAK